LMSSPVLILTGHFSWHMPSAGNTHKEMRGGGGGRVAAHGRRRHRQTSSVARCHFLHSVPFRFVSLLL
jgi:hypothetical protein